MRQRAVFIQLERAVKLGLGTIKTAQRQLRTANVVAGHRLGV